VRDGSWSIAEVARMSDVTSRTLRHYDAIGLLPPAWVAADGRRYYRRPELLRLQRILLLRELGLGLAAIAEALEREADPVAVLRGHRDRVPGVDRRRGGDPLPGRGHGDLCRDPC
jgi:DNA-binding transcriptional MerR regulator